MAKPNSSDVEVNRRAVHNRVMYLMDEAAFKLEQLAKSRGISDDEMSGFLAGYPDFYDAWTSFLEESEESLIPKEACE